MLHSCFRPGTNQDARCNMHHALHYHQKQYCFGKKQLKLSPQPHAPCGLDIVRSQRRGLVSSAQFYTTDAAHGTSFWSCIVENVDRMLSSDCAGSKQGSRYCVGVKLERRASHMSESLCVLQTNCAYSLSFKTGLEML